MQNFSSVWEAKVQVHRTYSQKSFLKCTMCLIFMNMSSKNFWKNNHWCLKPHWIISTLYLFTKFLVFSWYFERQSYLFFTNILRYGNYPAEYAVRASYKPKITVQGIFQTFRAMFDIGQKGDFLWKKGTKKFTPPYSIPLLHQNKAFYNFCKRGQRSIVHNIEHNIGLEFALQWLLLS